MNFKLKKKRKIMKMKNMLRYYFCSYFYRPNWMESIRTIRYLFDAWYIYAYSLSVTLFSMQKYASISTTLWLIQKKRYITSDRLCGFVALLVCSSVSGIGNSNNEYNFCFNFVFSFRFVRGSGSFLLISQQKRSRWSFTQIHNILFSMRLRFM